jgi:hypothetical protein
MSRKKHTLEPYSIRISKELRSSLEAEAKWLGIKVSELMREKLANPLFAPPAVDVTVDNGDRFDEGIVKYGKLGDD